MRIWNLEFGIWNLEFGIWNLEFGKMPGVFCNFGVGSGSRLIHGSGSGSSVATRRGCRVIEALRGLKSTVTFTASLREACPVRLLPTSCSLRPVPCFPFPASWFPLPAPRTLQPAPRSPLPAPGFALATSPSGRRCHPNRRAEARRGNVRSGKHSFRRGNLPHPFWCRRPGIIPWRR